MSKPGLLIGLLVLLAGLLLGSCRAGKADPGSDSGPRLHFGQGGGFTGAVTTFVLLPDGRLFRRGADETDTYLATLDKALARQLFAHFRQVEFDKIHFNEPGNLYRFIEWYDRGEMRNRLVWGAEGVKPPEGLAAFHHLLMQSTKPRS